MPSATSTFGWTLSNLGPLTSTFVAPSSCATITNVNLAFADRPEAVVAYEACTGTTRGDCWPSGSVIDSALAAADTDNPGLGYTINYFSPGLMCPTGWTTAGLATKAKGGSITSSGSAFVLPTTTTVDQTYLQYFYNPPANVLLGALDEEETAVICCPSTMTAMSDGYCFSVMSSSTVDTGCLRLIPTADISFITTEISMYGTTVSAELASFVHTSPITETRITTYPASEASSYVAVSYIAGVALVRREADLDLAKTTSGGGGAGSTGSSATPTTSPNAAVSTRLRHLDSVSGGVSLLWCIMAMAAGSSLFLAL